MRACDLEEGGRDDQFYFYDTRSERAVEAPRGTLALGDVAPALDGAYSVTLKGGKSVEVAPVFALLKERLKDYEPEQAQELCGVHPDVIRTLARKVATKKTHVYEGLATGKHYHGDLMGRSMYLLLALTGNWGKKGTGPTYWNVGPSTGGLLDEARRVGGPEELSQLIAAYNMLAEAAKAQDPTKTDEIAAIDGLANASAVLGPLVPAAQQYERPSAMGLSHTMFFNMADKAVEPAGESKPEWQIFRLLCRKLAERGIARGITEYEDCRGVTHRLDNLEEVFTASGSLGDEEKKTAQG